MSIADMQRFAELRRDGERTTADRLALLRRHRAEVEQRVTDLHEHLHALAGKIRHYEGVLHEHAGADTRDH